MNSIFFYFSPRRLHCFELSAFYAQPDCIELGNEWEFGHQSEEIEKKNHENCFLWLFFGQNDVDSVQFLRQRGRRRITNHTQSRSEGVIAEFMLFP